MMKNQPLKPEESVTSARTASLKGGQMNQKAQNLIRNALSTFFPSLFYITLYLSYCTFSLR